MTRSILVIFLALWGVSCAGSVRTVADVVVVEGQVTVRGNEPFTAVWLETDARNVYVLVLSDADRSALVTPSRYRAEGAVYRDEWNGTPLAHLRVSRLLPVDSL